MKTTTSATVGLLAGLLFSPGIAGADAVLEWNAIMVTVVSDQPPPFKNRFAAIMHLAVFDAVNAVKGEYKPYLARGTLPAASDAGEWRGRPVPAQAESSFTAATLAAFASGARPVSLEPPPWTDDRYTRAYRIEGGRETRRPPAGSGGVRGLRRTGRCRPGHDRPARRVRKAGRARRTRAPSRCSIWL